MVKKYLSRQEVIMILCGFVMGIMFGIALAEFFV